MQRLLADVCSPCWRRCREQGAQQPQRAQQPACRPMGTAAAAPSSNSCAGGCGAGGMARDCGAAIRAVSSSRTAAARPCGDGPAGAAALPASSGQPPAPSCGRTCRWAAAELAGLAGRLTQATCCVDLRHVPALPVHGRTALEPRTIPWEHLIPLRLP